MFGRRITFLELPHIYDLRNHIYAFPRRLNLMVDLGTTIFFTTSTSKLSQAFVRKKGPGGKTDERHLDPVAIPKSPPSSHLYEFSLDARPGTLSPSSDLELPSVEEMIQAVTPTSLVSK